MTSHIRELLGQLYAAAEADRTYAQLQARLTESGRQRKANTPSPQFSEADVVLITYGDSLRHPDEAPLQTLHRFAQQHLHGLISTIHILPFFPYSSDDGFAVQDFYAVNPALGDWGDVRALGADFALMFDAVFNHMSAQSDWFRRFLNGEADYAGLFRTESPETDLSGVTRPRVSPLLTAFQRSDGETAHVWTTFSADQVDFDLRDPATLLRLLDILLFYVEQGASMIRLDAIAYLWKEIGTSCIHLPQTHAAIKLMRAVLDQVAPEVLIITETNVPHAENISYWGDGQDEAQMVYNFTLPPLLLHTMLSGDTRQLREWVNSLQAPSPQTTFFNFTASHDGIGVRPVEGILSPGEIQALIDHTQQRGGRVSYKRNADGSDSAYELNISYVDAVTDPQLPQDLQVRQFLLTQALELALAGVPAIYVHSLLGSHNDLEGLRALGHNRAINRKKLDYDSVNAALKDPTSFRSQVFSGYRQLIEQRIQQPAFHPNAPQHSPDLKNDAVFALKRGSADAQILALFNLSPQRQTVALPARGQDLLSGQHHEARITLSPFQTVFLKQA